MPRSAQARRAKRERAIELALFACVLASLLTSCAIIWLFAGQSRAFFAELPFADWAFELEWGTGTGVLPLLAGTLLTTSIACLVAVPLGLLAAIYLAEYASARARRVLTRGLELLASLPTVVLGYFALAWVVPGLEGPSALSAGLVLGLMIVPTIAMLSVAALQRVPGSLREAAFGLGAGELQTIFGVVLPTAGKGLAVAVLVGLTRALGETMIVTMAAGVSAGPSLDPRAATSSLSAEILELSSGLPSPESAGFRGMFAIGTALLLLTLASNLIAQRLAHRSEDRSSVLAPMLGRWGLAGAGAGEPGWARSDDAPRRPGERGFRWVCAAAVLAPLLAVGLLLVGTLLGALGSSFAGVGQAALASLEVLALTALVVVPVGVGAAIYVEEYERGGRVAWLVRRNVAALADLPPLLYGLLGLALLVPTLGRGLLSAALTLALVILPLVFEASREAVSSVRPGLREAATALGATRWQVVRGIVLPAAFADITRGVLVALARAAGAAAPLLVLGLAGDSAPLAIDVFAGATDTSEAAGAVVVLLALVLGLELLARFVPRRAR